MSTSNTRNERRKNYRCKTCHWADKCTAGEIEEDEYKDDSGKIVMVRTVVPCGGWTPVDEHDPVLVEMTTEWRKLEGRREWFDEDDREWDSNIED